MCVCKALSILGGVMCCSVSTQDVAAQVNLLCGPVTTVRTRVWLLSRVGPNMFPQVIHELEHLATMVTHTRLRIRFGVSEINN